MASKLEQALALAEQGFFVFRLRANAKTPLATGWQQEATTDPDEIATLFDNDRDYNIGIFTGKYKTGEGKLIALVVVDVDTKEGKHGDATMQEKDILGFDFPPTRTIQTASGGRHLIYHYPYPLSGGANKIGLHVDLKSNGHYIVAEGSTINNTPYRCTDNHPISQAPQWIENQVGRPLERSHTDQALIDLDTGAALDQAKHYIEENAPTANPGNRNDTAYKVACKLHDFGVSETAADAFMFEWNQSKCHPHLSIEEVEHTLRSAYKSAKLPAGNDNPHSHFTPLPADPDENPRTNGNPPLYFVLPKDANAQQDFQCLVDDYFDAVGVSILYGDSNTGKTFVALDIAYHVATGKPWNGRDTLKGGVIYLAAEGGRSALNRVQALKNHYSTDDFPLALVPCQVNLFDSVPDFKAFIKLIRQAEAHPSLGPTRLIVIDTLSRVLAGGNENDSVDMGEFVKNITSLKEHFKTHILVVHHSGKDQAKGARGHSLLRAAVDTELEIADNLITTKKQRDMEFAKPQGFELTTVTVGTNYKGKPITSCVVNYVDADARAELTAANRLDHRDLIALLAIQQVQTPKKLRGFDHVIDQKTWAKCCKDFDITQIPGAKKWPENGGSFNIAFKRVRDRLSGFGRVVEIEDKQWAIVKTRQDDNSTTTPLP